jgi:hypothetical protein
MTLSIEVAKELDSSMVTKLADSVVTRLAIEIEKYQADTVDDKWFASALDLFVFSRVSKLFGSWSQFPVSGYQKELGKSSIRF